MASVKEVDAAAAAWFAKRDSGNWSQEDQQCFDEWMAADLSHRIAYIRVEAAWKKAHRLKALGAGRTDGSVPPVGEWNFTPVYTDHERSQRHASEEHHRRRRKWLAAGMLSAAMLVMTVGAVTWRHMLQPLPEYQTAVGGVATVPLDDGSTVMLNTDSNIRVALSPRARTIKLSRGEAYFDVAKDAERPFVVEAGNKRVMALGTKFSVWHEDDVLRVAVTEGLVRVEGDQRGGVWPIHLRPGEIATGEGNRLSIEEKPVEMIDVEYLSWRNGFVVFNDTPLAEALEQINRYNHEKVIVRDPTLKELRIGGTFRATNVHAFLRLLEQGLPVQTVKEGNRIYLQPADRG